jgi:organic hydroperoxide reductase OsmC/OhrA
MPKPFPHRYEISLSRQSDHSAVIHNDSASPVAGGVPPQFDGKPGFWSPEELLMSAVALCFMTTFQSFALKERIEILSYTSSAVGILDKTQAGLLFTQIELQIKIRVNRGVRETVIPLIERSKKYCIISNTLRPAVEVVAEIKEV